MFDPATAFVGPVTVTTMSACGVTAVLTCAPPFVPTLFVGFGSLVGDEADALLNNEPLAGAFIVTVNAAVALESKVVAGHVTTLPPPKVPPPLALTNVAFAGSASTVTMLLAVDGPRFVTVMV